MIAMAGVLVSGFFCAAMAHAIGGTDAAFVAKTVGPDPFPFLYLGAKHMVTGYDHLLFLVGVIFFLYRFKDIALYVTMFSIGHSITLLAGVLFKLHVDAHLFGVQPDNRPIVLGFGLVHGFGLATKLQALNLNPHGLITNLISFNVGVEIGQIIALSLFLMSMTVWRKTPLFDRTAAGANVLIMVAGSVFMIHQLAGYFLGAV